MSGTSNRTIAKNTVFLYLRLLVLICVNFYTTRVVLEALGIDDYGLYNVVAGFVTMITFINQSLTTSIQRFLNFEIGKGNENSIRTTFSSSIFTQLLLIGVVLIIAETIGLWFINNRLSIAHNSIFETNVVYQASILTVLINIYRSAFNAVIIAKEKMKFYALISLIEGVLQLGVAGLLLILGENRLIAYAILLVFVSTIITFIYISYSTKLLPGITHRAVYEKSHLKQILSFSGWNIIGAGTGVFRTQGLNVIINIFFGVTVNAAQSIAVQVQTCIFRIASNFQVAMYPQIIQSYAQNNRNRYLNLCYSCYKISVYFVWIITLPLIICAPEILKLWLGDNVPPYASLFVIIISLIGIVDSLGAAISTPIYATGNIKRYQIEVSSITLLILPIAWWLYRAGYPPESAFYALIVVSILAQMSRVRIWCRLINESTLKYLKSIALPSLSIIALSTCLTWVISDCMNTGILKIITTIIVSLIINAFAIFTIGLNNREKEKIITIARQRIRTIK